MGNILAHNDETKHLEDLLLLNKFCNISEIYHAHKQNVHFYSVADVKNRTVMFTCLYNFHLVSGDLVHQCGHGGKWTGRVPVCEVDEYKEKKLLASFIFLVSFLVPFLWLSVDFYLHMQKRFAKTKRYASDMADRKKYQETVRSFHSKLGRSDDAGRQVRLRSLLDLRAEVINARSNLTVHALDMADLDESWADLSPENAGGASNRSSVSSIGSKRNTNENMSKCKEWKEAGDREEEVEDDEEEEGKEEKTFMRLEATHPLVRLGKMVREFLMKPS